MQNQFPSQSNERTLMTVQHQRQRYTQKHMLASLIPRPFSVLHAETLKAWNEPGNEATYKLQVHSGAQNNNEEEEGKGMSAKHPHERLKISKFSHGSHVTKFRTMAQCAWC